MMEEEQTNIKKIITTIDNEKSYSIDVDETTTFYEFKKILAAAAHLLKNCFRIYHEQQEYTNDYDDNTIQEMFPDLDPIPLRIISNKDVYEFEDELISVRFNINVPCQIHIGKYKMLYCFTCNKSICMDCFNADHKGHSVEEKADYLAPAQLLMNNIFSNSALFRADSRLSKYMECVNFRSNLKLNVFDNLRKMINDLEIKFASCLEYFSTSEDETEKNTNENLELLKKYCIECFIKLKNDINTKGIIIDDEIFLTLYRKLKEIERYKNEYFEENKQKYEKLNTLLAPFIHEVEKISEELKSTFNTLLNKELYENFKNLVQENIVEKVQKETVNDFMFRNLGVPRKSLNRMSLGNLNSYKKKSKDYVSPNKLVQKEEKSPFPRANLSAERKENNSGTIFGQGVFSKSKNEQGNKNSTLTWNKTEEQNPRVKGLSIIGQNNDISMKDATKTTAFENRVITTTTNNMNMANVSGTLTNNMNNNISNFSNQEKTGVFRASAEKEYPGQTKIYSTQSEFQISNLGNFGNMINSSQTQGQNIVSKEITKTTATNNITTFTQGFDTNSNSNMFGGKLIEVLSNEIGKKGAEYEIEKGTTNESNTAIFETNNMTSTVAPDGGVSGMLNKGSFLIMYPIFESNYILGAFADESTGRAEVDFEKAFGEKDIQLKAFPQGGAFCNYEKYLFFTGGQEKQKGVGKIFLRITINAERETKAKMVKMPSMLYPHWNHSMISNGNYIFVIGGYNTNKCEAFNLRTLKWEAMPDLISPERQKATLAIYGDYLYAFMGQTQFNVLDSVERINIKKLGSSNWENVIYSNPNKVNTKFYGAGVYIVKGQLFFLGGKLGLGDDQSDFKSEIYRFKFDTNEFLNTDICYNGKINFIENEFHHISDDNVGNFISVDNGVLATMPVSSLLQQVNI
jgi:hypothetical protein